MFYRATKGKTIKIMSLFAYFMERVDIHNEAKVQSYSRHYNKHTVSSMFHLEE